LVRLLSWETLLIQIIEFLTEWPNHRLSKSDVLILSSISFLSKSFPFNHPRFMSQFIELTLILQVQINQLIHFSSIFPRFSYIQNMSHIPSHDNLCLAITF
jgi:hypothetical protein